MGGRRNAHIISLFPPRGDRETEKEGVAEKCTRMVQKYTHGGQKHTGQIQTWDRRHMDGQTEVHTEVERVMELFVGQGCFKIFKSQYLIEFLRYEPNFLLVILTFIGFKLS